MKNSRLVFPLLLTLTAWLLIPGLPCRAAKSGGAHVEVLSDSGEEILLVVTWTVLASVFLHGLSSQPLTRRYADWFALHGRADMAEAVEVDEMPTR